MHTVPCGPLLRHLALPASCRQTYVLKLAKSGEDGDKVLLLIESGARFHTVEVGGRAEQRVEAGDGCMHGPALDV